MRFRFAIPYSLARTGSSPSASLGEDGSYWRLVPYRYTGSSAFSLIHSLSVAFSVSGLFAPGMGRYPHRMVFRS